MDDPTKLDLAAALEVIEDLLREQLKTSGRIPETIVTVGGTALAALRIRERSDDVDLYMSEIDDTAIHTVTEKYRARYGFDFKIDATPGNTIWGSRHRPVANGGNDSDRGRCGPHPNSDARNPVSYQGSSRPPKGPDRRPVDCVEMLL
jgi:hypothetical protein